MSSDVQAAPPKAWLFENIDVVHAPSLVDCLDAWSVMRDQRDLARDVAVELENENAELRALLAVAYSGTPTAEQRHAARLYVAGDGLGVDC